MSNLYKSHYPENKREEALEFIRKILGYPKNKISVENSAKLLNQFSNISPTYISNNHNTRTECYKIKNKTYLVHYRIYDNPVIDEIIDHKL